MPQIPGYDYGSPKCRGRPSLWSKTRALEINGFVTDEDAQHLKKAGEMF